MVEQRLDKPSTKVRFLTKQPILALTPLTADTSASVARQSGAIPEANSICGSVHGVKGPCQGTSEGFDPPIPLQLCVRGSNGIGTRLLSETMRVRLLPDAPNLVASGIGIRAPIAIIVGSSPTYETIFAYLKGIGIPEPLKPVRVSVRVRE
jgi:hypothetical protein